MAGPESGMVIAVPLVNDLVPVGRLLTVNRKLASTLYCPSLTLTVMVAVPDWPAAGVTVTVRLAPLPPRLMLPRGTRAGLEELLLRIRLARPVSTSPIVKLNGPVELSTLMFWLAMLEIAGGSLIAL